MSAGSGGDLWAWLQEEVAEVNESIRREAADGANWALRAIVLARPSPSSVLSPSASGFSTGVGRLGGVLCWLIVGFVALLFDFFGVLGGLGMADPFDGYRDVFPPAEAAGYTSIFWSWPRTSAKWWSSPKPRSQSRKASWPSRAQCSRRRSRLAPLTLCASGQVSQC
jgi:hypothetical protein